MTHSPFLPVPTRYTHILRLSHGEIVDIGELCIDEQISIACNLDTLPTSGVNSHLWINRFSILLPCPIHTTRSRKPWVSGTNSKHQIKIHPRKLRHWVCSSGNDPSILTMLPTIQEHIYDHPTSVKGQGHAQQAHL